MGPYSQLRRLPPRLTCGVGIVSSLGWGPKRYNEIGDRWHSSIRHRLTRPAIEPSTGARLICPASLDRPVNYSGVCMSVSPQLPVLDFSQIGPKVGSRLPDIRLPNQAGRLVDLHAERGHRRALVVFYRSARW